MNPGASKSLVLASGGLMLVFIALQPPPRYKRAWAAGVITLGLSLLADVAPEVAGPFAVLVLLALAAKERGTLGTLLGNVTGHAVPGDQSTGGHQSGQTAGGTAPRPGRVTGQ